MKMNTWRNKLQQTSNKTKSDLQKRATGQYKQFGFDGFGGGSFGGGGAGNTWFEQLQNAAGQYIRRTPIPGKESFSAAFKRARDNGYATFFFNGKEFTTEISDNPQYVGKRYQDTIDAVVREVLDENMRPMKDSTRLEPYVGQMLGIYKRSE